MPYCAVMRANCLRAMRSRKAKRALTVPQPIHGSRVQRLGPAHFRIACLAEVVQRSSSWSFPFSGRHCLGGLAILLLLLARRRDSTDAVLWCALLCRFQNLHRKPVRNDLAHDPSLATHLERAQQCVVDAHHRTRIVKLSAVIRGREQGDQLPFCEEFVTVFHDLVGAANQVHVVLCEESRDDVATERETGKKVAERSESTHTSRRDK